MNKPSNPLILRQEALRATIARFQGKPFVWGTTDCWIMTRAHLRALGERPPATPRYRTALGAKKALKLRGFDSMADAIDSILPRISPAEMLPGDVAAVEGVEGLDALVICAGHKVFGWHEEADGPVFIVPKPGALTIAWRAQ
jgi:hypothetical protein